MISMKKLSRFKKMSALVLLIVFVTYLGLPTLAFSRPPNIVLSSGEITDSFSTGDPVGGERKDDKYPSLEGINFDEGMLQGSFSDHSGGSIPVDRQVRVRVVVLPLVGIWGGKTLTIILTPFLRVSSDGR
jgi:hypothetical protein